MANDPATRAGAATYTPLFLRFIYNTVILRFAFFYAWGCSEKILRNFFNTQVTSSQPTHPGEPWCLLDIGVGTGYFLEHAPLRPHSHVVLADLNPNCLDAATFRVYSTHPTVEVDTLVADFLATDDSGQVLSPSRLGETRFNAISCNLLLHCLPGPVTRKAEALARLGPLLCQHGVLFGSTILGRGVRHNLLGRLLMFWYNKVGVFGNCDDSADAIVLALNESFADVEWEVVGRTLLFRAGGYRHN